LGRVAQPFRAALRRVAQPFRAAFIATCFFATIAAAQSAVDAQLHKEALPSEIPSSVATLLAPGGARAKVGAVVLDFWWVKALPLAGGSGEASWNAVEEGSLVGAVRLSADFRDIRGRILKQGPYTLRFGVQPDNGDHLGTSPFREFLLLLPAALDTDPAPRGHQGSIDISKLAVGGSHPAVWSIDPPSTTDAVLAPHTTELGHRAVLMEVPVVRDGKPAGTLRFGVVLVGRIDA